MPLALARLTCRVRRRPAILWAANCGALAWVQASHSCVFARALDRVSPFFFLCRVTAGALLLTCFPRSRRWTAGAALRGACVLVRLRPDACPLTWQRAQVGHLVQYDGAALHLFRAGPALGAPSTRARCARARCCEHTRISSKQGGAHARRNPAARYGSLLAAACHLSAALIRAIYRACVIAQSKRIRRPCFWRTAFTRRW